MKTRWYVSSIGSAAIAILIWLGILHAIDTGVAGDAPTTYTAASGGGPITNLTAIRLYRKIITGANPPACPTDPTQYAVFNTQPFTTPGARFTFSDPGLTVNGRYCYFATALLATGEESDPSNITFKDVDLRKPNPPTNVTVN